MAAIMSPQAAVEAHGLSKSYHGRLVTSVDELSIPPGETFVLLGRNGSGKSTLLRMLALLEAPDSGRISYFGRPVHVKDLPARRRMAIVLQRPVAFQGKVWRNVALGLKLRRDPRAEIRSRVDEILEMLDIAHLAQADARRLSGGELQRVALARALVLRPDILFLDEPTSALDPSVRARFRHDLMGAARRLGSTVVLVTHDQVEALGLADRLAVMDEGRIVQQGPSDEVITKPRSRTVAALLGTETIWRGRVEDTRQGLCLIRTRAGLPVEVVSNCPRGEEVTVAIRAEDLALSVEAGPGSASSVRNRWPGIVEELTSEGSVVRVRVRLGRPGARPSGDGLPGVADSPSWLADPGVSGDSMVDCRVMALVTRPAVAELGLMVGTKVVVAVKATAIHVLED